MNTLYSVDDLVGGGDIFSKMTPPARLAVFGDPVAHSKSPFFQNAALREAGIEAGYVKIHSPLERAREAFRALPRAGFLGANVTVRLKAAALHAVDAADAYAIQAGSVNTLLVDGNRIFGYNTDGPGLVRAIRENFSAELGDLRVVLLGAGGGAGRAIAVQCARESCKSLVLANRTFEKARQLAEELAPSFAPEGHPERLRAIPIEEEALARELAEADIVINAASVGMRRSDPSLVPASLLTPNLLIYDTVYASGKSRLLQDAEQAGARCANGLSMLLHQGALSFEIWFQREAPLEVMRQALASAP